MDTLWKIDPVCVVRNFFFFLVGFTRDLLSCFFVGHLNKSGKKEKKKKPH